MTAFSPIAEAGEPPAKHFWSRIEYQPIPISSEEKIDVLVQSGGRDDVPGFRFDIIWNAAEDVERPELIADEGKIAVRLHLANGEVISPVDGKRPRSWAIAGMSGSTTHSLIYKFPWGPNRMDEAWIELTLPGQKYWIEIPYGFVRDPAAEPPSDAKAGAAVLPPVLKSIGETDKLVAWTYVNYPYRLLPNGWKLGVKVGNPANTRATALLYKEGLGALSVHNPRTQMEIKAANGNVITGDGTAIRLIGEVMHRHDDHVFRTYPEDGRDWGRIKVKVNADELEWMIPSSLFKKLHGVAEPMELRKHRLRDR